MLQTEQQLQELWRYQEKRYLNYFSTLLPSLLSKKYFQ